MQQKSCGQTTHMDLWHGIQLACVALSAVLVYLLVFHPAVGLNLFWNTLIPIAPALIVIWPGLWRNVCPVASLSQLPRRLGFSSARELPPDLSGWLAMAALFLLLLILPLRHIVLNHDGRLTALMLILAVMAALWTGARYRFRSGWCAALCPIHPVEKLYGFAPAATFENRQCGSCAKCTQPCPDSTKGLLPVVSRRGRFHRIVGNLLAGGFAGYVWGWYQVPDYPGGAALPQIIAAYAWPIAGFVVSYLCFAVCWGLLKTKRRRFALVRVFACAAVVVYYWYRLPMLVGFGAFPETGVLVDLSADLPGWYPAAAHLLSSSFFIWFMLIRRAPAASWLKRPPVAGD